MFAEADVTLLRYIRMKTLENMYALYKVSFFSSSLEFRENRSDSLSMLLCTVNSCCIIIQTKVILRYLVTTKIFHVARTPFLAACVRNFYKTMTAAALFLEKILTVRSVNH